MPELAMVLAEDGGVVALGATPDVLRRHARELHAAGCWLPLETELYALTGVGHGRRETANRELLVSMSLDGGDRSGSTVNSGRETVLSTRQLSASRRSVTPTRRRGRRNDGPDVSPLLREVDLDLRGGEVVALLGANGSGKSTLLLTLAGLLPPASGSIEGARPGLVFQNPEHQFMDHTVAGEIGHGLGEDREEVTARQLRLHRLEHHAGSSPFRLSGGEKRRLSIAAMLAHDRPALLLDEPTLGLDRRDTIATMTALRRAAGEGRGILFASHDLRTVATLADRVVILTQGQVVADGPVHNVLGDGEVLARAKLELPPLVDWLIRSLPSSAAVRRTLRALDQEITPTLPMPPPTGQIPTGVEQR